MSCAKKALGAADHQARKQSIDLLAELYSQMGDSSQAYAMQRRSKELQCLVDYFAQLRPKRWQEWERKYKDLSTAQYVFLIMQDDLRYDDEAIAAALDVKRPSVRSMRSRIKGRER